MLLTKPIIKYLTQGVIAPHGMTDLIHAQQNNLSSQLYQINALSIVSSLLLNKFNQDILNDLFFLSSIIHFRHDMPKIMKLPRYFLSFFMIFSFLFIKMDLFMYYMIFIHVPNHYKMSWSYLKNEKWRSFFTLLISTLLFIKGGQLFDMNLLKPLPLNLIKGLIISHIIYEEVYIHKNKNKLNIFIQNKLFRSNYEI